MAGGHVPFVEVTAHGVTLAGLLQFDWLGSHAWPPACLCVGSVCVLRLCYSLLFTSVIRLGVTRAKFKGTGLPEEPFGTQTARKPGRYNGKPRSCTCRANVYNH